MATTQFYSNGTGDGAVAWGGPFGDWAATRAGTAGAFGPDLDASDGRSYACNTDYGVSAFGTYAIARGFLCFDTSSLPDGATVTAATLSVYCYAKATGLSGNVCLVSSTAGTTLAAGDRTAVGTTELMDRTTALGGSATTFANFTTSAHNVLTLNASGLSQISTSGNTKFAFRTSFDLDNTTPGSGIGYVAISTALQAGTSEDPILEVTYTLPGGPPPANPSRRIRGLYAR